MREFIESISFYARKTADSNGNINRNFIVIPQNGQSVAWNIQEASGTAIPDTEPDAVYISAISAIGREDTFYGYNHDNILTAPAINAYFVHICQKYSAKFKPVFSIDYCHTAAKIRDSYSSNKASGFISFAAPDKNLRIIPENTINYKDTGCYPFDVNAGSIHSPADAKNFLYLLDGQNFTDSTDSVPGTALITALSKTDYDVIIMDAFTNDGSTPFSKEQITSLKIKAHGGNRLVIAYMSIGEAENYRFYWSPSWVNGTVRTEYAPAWLDAVNPDWAGNFKVRYWDKDWQAIIYGSTSSYTKKLIDAGFDGVYLDVVDAYEYYEDQDSRPIQYCK